MTALSFFVAGALPLIPYLFGVSREYQFSVSMIATAISLFVVGTSRTIVTGVHWLRSGCEMLFVGSIAAGAAFFVGALVKRLFGLSL